MGEALAGGEEFARVDHNCVVAQLLGHGDQRDGDVHGPNHDQAAWWQEALEVDIDRFTAGPGVTARRCLAARQHVLRVADHLGVEVGVAEGADGSAVLVDQHLGSQRLPLDERCLDDRNLLLNGLTEC